MCIKKCITTTRQFSLANELTRHQCGSNQTLFTVCVSFLILPIKDGGVGQFKPFKTVITDSVVCPAVHLKYSRWYNRLLITSCENKPDCHGSPYFLPAIHRVVIQWRKKKWKIVRRFSFTYDQTFRDAITGNGSSKLNFGETSLNFEF